MKKNKWNSIFVICSILFLAAASSALAEDPCPTCTPPPVNCCDFDGLTGGLTIDTNDVIDQATNLGCDFMETHEMGLQTGVGHMEVSNGVTGEISALLYHNQVIDQQADLPNGYNAEHFGAAESALYAKATAGEPCNVADFDIGSHRDMNIINAVNDDGGMQSNLAVNAGGHVTGSGLNVELGMEHYGAAGYNFTGPDGFQTGLVQFHYAGGDIPSDSEN